ncbi:phage portal protein [Neobacillus drentensis]|uniref:phage portal protein n=1 Tax=Neobacillus drentensis TaxID=220684 RepID=UPI002FFE6CAD
MKFTNRLRLAFSPKNTIYEVLQQYATDFLAGEDVPTESTSLYGVSALKLTSVFACNRVLAETLASCPVFLYEKDENGNRKQVSSNASELLRYAPNPDMTPVQFKESGATNINLGGNFFAQKVKNGLGDVIQLRPVPWNVVSVKFNATTNRLEYDVDGKTMTRDDILHIPGLTFDGYIGVTPITYAQNALNTGKNQDEFTNNFYNNSVQTSGAFEYPDELSDPAFKRLKEDIKTNYRGLKNSGTPLILEGGGKYREFTMKLSDAQFIESKRFSVEDICRLFRVPLHLVQDLSRSTNNNIEHQSLEFVMYTMLPWFKRWEENFNLQLLTTEDKKQGRYFEFKIDALLRGDAKTRAESYAIGRQWGWLSVNDIRRMENMNPIPNGDIYLQPSNMYEAGKQPQVKAQAQLVEEIYNMIKERGDN